MNERMERLIPEIKLPPYSITKYSSRYVGGDDLKDTYQIVFKNGKDLALKRTLDSLLIVNPKWKNIDNEYVYDTIFWEDEIVDSIIIRPLDGSATFINYKWQSIISDIIRLCMEIVKREIHFIKQFDWNHLRSFSISRWPEDMGTTHGVEHWDRVARFGRMLYQKGADMDVIMAFAYLHDIERKDNAV